MWILRDVEARLKRSAKTRPGTDTRGDATIAGQFDSITPENVLKWERIHPKPERYDFTLADTYVEFGENHHMFIVGHTLCWHSQTPAWVFTDEKGMPLSREALLQRLHDHIVTVVGRYKGRIQSWDVVNEALNQDGTLRQSKWMQIIGEDYILHPQGLSMGACGGPKGRIEL